METNENRGSQTHCQFIRYRLYNFTATGNADPTINQSFLSQLRALCPNNGDGTIPVPLDKDSQTDFDTSFFKNVRDGNGVLESDQRLWDDAATYTRCCEKICWHHKRIFGT